MRVVRGSHNQVRNLHGLSNWQLLTADSLLDGVDGLVGVGLRQGVVRIVVGLGVPGDLVEVRSVQLLRHGLYIARFLRRMATVGRCYTCCSTYCYVFCFQARLRTMIEEACILVDLGDKIRLCMLQRLLLIMVL